MSSLEELMGNAIKEIAVAIRNAGMYTPNHPMAKRSVQKAYDVFNEAVSQAGSLTLKVVEGKLIVNNKRVGDGKNPMFSEFADDLSNREVAALTFKKGVSLEEFNDFVHILTIKADNMEKTVKEYFEEKNIRGIQAVDLRYDRLGIGAGGGGFPDEMFNEVMLGKIKDFFGKDKDKVLDHLSENPEKIIKMMKDLAVEQTAGLSGMAKQEKEAEILAESIENLWSSGLEADATAKKNFLPELAKELLNLSPDVRTELIKRQLESGGKEVAKAISGYFSLQDLMEVIPKDKDKIADIKKMIKELIPNLNRRKQLLSKVGKELVKHGISKQQYNEIAEDVLWEGLALNVKLERLIKRKKILEGDAEKFCNLIEEVLAKKRPDIAQKLVTNLFAGLKQNDWKIRRDIALISNNLLEVLGKDPKLAKLQTAVAQIIEKMKKSESNKEVLAAFSGEAPAEKEAVTKKPPKIDNVEEILEGVGEKPSGEQRKIKKKVVQAGARAIAPVIDMLHSLEEDSSDKPILWEILGEIGGEKAFEELKGLLLNDSAEIVAKGVELLGKFDHEKALEEISTIISHPDENVRTAIADVLSEIESERAGEILAIMLKSEKENKLRNVLLDKVTEKPSPQGVSALINLAQNEKDDNFRKKCIKALGVMKAEEAVAPLTEMLEKKGFLGRMGESKEIRELCAYSLAEIGNDKAIAVLKRAQKSDPDKSVQHLCKIKLKDLE